VNRGVLFAGIIWFSGYNFRIETSLGVASFQEKGARATLRATLVGEPDVREGYDLGGTVVRMCGVCSHTIARLLLRPRSGESSNASRYGSGMGGAPGLEREMGMFALLGLGNGTIVLIC
jgi:hypothetical protein